MTKKDRLLCFLLCALFGFLGGVLSTLSARAKAADQTPSVVKTRSLQIVDEQGNVLAAMEGRQLEFYSRRGHTKLSLGAQFPFREPGERRDLYDRHDDAETGFIRVYDSGSDRNVLWSVPGEKERRRRDKDTGKN